MVSSAAAASCLSVCSGRGGCVCQCLRSPNGYAEMTPDRHARIGRSPFMCAAAHRWVRWGLGGLSRSREVPNRECAAAVPDSGGYAVPRRAT